MSQFRLTKNDKNCNNEQPTRHVNEDIDDLPYQHLWKPSILQLQGICKWYKLHVPKHATRADLLEVISKVSLIISIALNKCNNCTLMTVF